MKYEIHLLDEVTHQIIHHFDSVFVPIVGDLIPLTPQNGTCFIVNSRMLPDSDSNRMICFGKKQVFRGNHNITHKMGNDPK